MHGVKVGGGGWSSEPPSHPHSKFLTPHLGFLPLLCLTSLQCLQISSSSDYESILPVLKINKQAASMQSYVCFLRGINIGGSKQVKMTNLIEIFESCGFSNVQTYLQSGNVVFQAQGISSPSSVAEAIHLRMKESLNFDIPIIVRSASEIEMIRQNIPFNVDVDKAGTTVHVCFVNKSLTQERIQKLNAIDGRGDSLSVHDETFTEIYLHCPNGYARSSISSIHLEKNLGKEYFCTVRNWNTLSAVSKMISHLETITETVPSADTSGTSRRKRGGDVAIFAGKRRKR